MPTDLKKRANQPGDSWFDSHAGRQGVVTPAEPASNADQAIRIRKRDKTLDKGRKLVLYFVLALLFIRISLINQILEYLVHVNTYILYFVGIPVLIAIAFTQGLRRVFQYRPTWYWLSFALWLIPTAAVSTWKSGSFAVVFAYYRTELVLLFAVGGFVTTWKECRWLMYTISAAALVNTVSFLLFRSLDSEGRLRLNFGAAANSNDYSGHLIFVLPFVLWLVLIARSSYVKIVAFFALSVGLYEILAAGSRGALLGLVTAVVVFVATTTSKVRRIVMIATPVLAIVVFAILPTTVVHRVFLFSADDSGISAGAMESSRLRQRLLEDSIAMTIRYPLFGVGPGQFSNFEGQQTSKSEERLWYEAHNSFMEIASENGLIGLALYLASIVSSLLLLNRTGRFLAAKPNMKEAAAAVSCIRIALIGFCVAIFFLNFGYFFYLPAMTGIIIAIATGSKQRVRDLVSRNKPKTVVPSGPIAATADWAP